MTESMIEMHPVDQKQFGNLLLSEPYFLESANSV